MKIHPFAFTMKRLMARAPVPLATPAHTTSISGELGRKPRLWFPWTVEEYSRRRRAADGAAGTGNAQADYDILDY